MGDVTLGEAARRARVSKTTLARMLARGEVSGQKEGEVWRIDESEIARVIDARKKPQRGKRREVPVEDAAPSAVVEVAVLRAQLEAMRDRLADALAREEQARADAVEALRREREAMGEVRRLLTDQRRPRGFWARLVGGD